MHIIKPSGSLAWLFLMFFCCAASAQETERKCLPGTDCPQEEETKPKLEIAPVTVVVTAGFQDGAVILEPTKTVIDLEQFESSGSLDRVEDVLKHMTGIDVIQGTGGADPQQVIMMRGFDDSRFQVAINGRPVTAPTAGADTFVDWSSLTTGDIERIEIIRGSSSARYENSAGGIINILTKRGEKSKNLVPRTMSEVSYESFNTFNARGTTSGGIGNLTYFVNFGSRLSDGYLKNNYWEGMDYSGRLDYSLPNKGILSASFKRSELEHGYPVVNDPDSEYAVYDPDYPIVTEDADTLRMGRTMAYPGGQSFKDKKATHFDLAYDQPLGNSSLSIKLFQDRGSEDSYSYELSKGTLVQKFSGHGNRKERTSGVMVDYQMNFWRSHSLGVGYSHRRMEVHNTPDIYRIQGAYIEDQMTVGQKLIFNLGLRYAHVREFSYAYADPGTSISYRHKIYTKLWLPKFTATYLFGPKTEAYFSANRDYHFPGC